MEIDKRDGLEDEEERKESHDIIVEHHLSAKVCTLLSPSISPNQLGHYQDVDFHVIINVGGGVCVCVCACVCAAYTYVCVYCM